MDYYYSNYEEKIKFLNITSRLYNDIILNRLSTGKEKTVSTGDSAPYPHLMDCDFSFFEYFKQRFSQLSSNPIDYIREDNRVGIQAKTISGFSEGDIIYNTPILTGSQFHEICHNEGIFATRFSITYREDLEISLNNLVSCILNYLKNSNNNFIILHDFNFSQDDKIIPVAMVVGMLNIEINKLKIDLTIIVATCEAFDVHGLACLLNLGADYVFPYMLYIDYNQSRISNDNQVKLQHSISKDIQKILAKNTCSSIGEYACLAGFDIVGLDTDIYHKCFNKLKLSATGHSFSDVDRIIARKHSLAFDTEFTYDDSDKSLHHIRLKHSISQKSVKSLHSLLKHGKEEFYSGYVNNINNDKKRLFRDFFDIHSDRSSIHIDKIQSSEEIFQKISSAGMSLGAISPEAHECLAQAMNSLGSKSNSGEGGEDDSRLDTVKNSRIKQIAAGRFGVTPVYILSADELQIKISQGAKPGEGAELPGSKVTDHIAKLRFTNAGSTIISPPANHDISSENDLHNLVQSLKLFNPDAIISIKLAASEDLPKLLPRILNSGIEKIVISGADGGTGAAQLSTLRNCGVTFEAPLIKINDWLIKNSLRNRILLEVDGGIRTGLDIVKAAIMGADSFSLGTPFLVAMGCTLCRDCFKNTCSVGIATQNLELRSKFNSTTDNVINFMHYLADDIRDILSHIGYCSLDEVKGMSHLIYPVNFCNLSNQYDDDSFIINSEPNHIISKVTNYAFHIFDEIISSHIDKFDLTSNDSFDMKSIIVLSRLIFKYNKINEKHVGCDVRCIGSNDDGVGSFLVPGLSIVIDGGVGNYLARGMSGGRIAVLADKKYACIDSALYGATGGELFLSGVAGERFAIRNSGAVAVVDSVGDNACEYMTKGVVVVLGDIGSNFGAGMSGGLAFVLGDGSRIIKNINANYVFAERLTNPSHVELLIRLLNQHYLSTKSIKVEDILKNHSESLEQFHVVYPKPFL